MGSRTGRFSYLIQPLICSFDIAGILVFSFLLSFSTAEHMFFAGYVILSWLISTLGFGYYKIYRFTPLLKILYLLSRQFVVFALIVFAFFGILNSGEFTFQEITEYIVLSFVLIGFFKIGVFNLLKKYRILLGGNIRRVIIIGINPKTKSLKKFFTQNQAYGYHFLASFDLRRDDIKVVDVIEYVNQNNIDELYCSVAELRNEEIADLVNFADNNLKTIKFLPDNKEIFTKKLDFEYYGITPVLSLRKLPIETPVNLFLKRGLDVFISLIVLIGILPWLTLILAVLIKSESKGPVFFRQKRNGLDNQEFTCYKFRSMYLNEEADLSQVSRNDQRITRTGKFLRKTSIDELPQFYNVLKGDMSVVGPRPHMVSHTHLYASRIDKFMLRHLIKPGITGLAQVSGYRGEVVTPQDIKNRVRFDIFYLENWSILMDLRIIAKTIIKSIQGDRKAY